MLKIKELRQEKNLSQKELAEKLDTSNKNIWAYENNIATPSVEMLIKIASLFDVSIDYLVGKTTDYVSISNNSQLSTLSIEEQKLLKAFKQLDARTKARLIEDAEYFAKKQVKV